MRPATKAEIKKHFYKTYYGVVKLPTTAFVVEYEDAGRTIQHFELFNQDPNLTLEQLYRNLQNADKNVRYEFEEKVMVDKAIEQYETLKCSTCKNRLTKLTNDYCSIRGKYVDDHLAQWRYRGYNGKHKMWKCNCAKYEEQMKKTKTKKEQEVEIIDVG